jgi:hypothetical protein
MSKATTATTTPTPFTPPNRPPNTITRSELAELDPAARQRFRDANGTVVEDNNFFADQAPMI